MTDCDLILKGFLNIFFCLAKAKVNKNAVSGLFGFFGGRDYLLVARAKNAF